MPSVTTITAHPTTPNRVIVTLDDGVTLTLSLDTLLSSALRAGDQLTPDQIDTLRAQEMSAQAYGAVLAYIAHRPRSQAEIERYLQRRQVPDAACQQIIERLQRARLLDDADFATRWVENRQATQPRGQLALRAELRQKGIPRDTAEDAVSQAFVDEPEEETAYRAGRRRAQMLASQPYAAFQRKLGDFLLRRGFKESVARRTTRRLWAEIGVNSPDAEAPTDPDSDD